MVQQYCKKCSYRHWTDLKDLFRYCPYCGEKTLKNIPESDKEKKELEKQIKNER